MNRLNKFVIKSLSSIMWKRVLANSHSKYIFNFYQAIVKLALLKAFFKNRVLRSDFYFLIIFLVIIDRFFGFLFEFGLLMHF